MDNARLEALRREALKAIARYGRRRARADLTDPWRSSLEVEFGYQLLGRELSGIGNLLAKEHGPSSPPGPPWPLGAPPQGRRGRL